jgi:hypothetical protein
MITLDAIAANQVPGITCGLPFDQYLQLEGDSASKLKKAQQSPLNYKWDLDHPDHSSTPAMMMGTATHTAVLEPHRLKTDYILWDQGDKRGKAWTDFRDAHADKSILSISEFMDVKGMRTAICSHAPAARYLEHGLAEVTIEWVDPVTGRKVHGRIDWLTYLDGRFWMADLKTTRNSARRKFQSDAFGMGYHLQFALYCDGFHALTGEYPGFAALAVESKAPYEPAVYVATEDFLSRGHDDYQRLMATLNVCESTGIWPARATEEMDLDLPGWAGGNDSEDNDLSDLGLIA